MAEECSRWDYLFVSDLHLSLGYDPERRAYHAREDFFFDEVFFRWLRWADINCAEGRCWELVFVGDTFDFLPVDRSILQRYFVERERRQRELDLSQPQGYVRYWQQQFSGATDLEVEQRIRRLLFEDDVLEGRVRLVPLEAEEVTARAAGTISIPAWAVELYRSYWPAAQHVGKPLVLRAPGEGGERPPVPRCGEPAAVRDEDFERTCGFLPTPEKSADKVLSIYHGHPLFFRALAWFVGRGHRLVFVRGNHDVELFWPQVQDRIRECIAREYAAAFGPDERGVPEDFQERIDFRPGWFHYRENVFYAEHGHQYEPLNSLPNPIRPVMPNNDCVLNPPVGNLGVECLHNHLEDEFPEWENRGEHATVLWELLRRHPTRMLALLVRHGTDFLRIARRAWMAGKAQEQGPTPADFARYAQAVGLDEETVEGIYHEFDRPLLMRRSLAWFLFSPPGHVLKLLFLLLLLGVAIGAGVLWYLFVAPWLVRLLPEDVLFGAGSALRFLLQILLWTLPPIAYEALRRRFERLYPEPFLYWAARRVHEHVADVDPGLQCYVLGHDHRPDVRIVDRRPGGSHVYYLNTGSWTPWFAERARRLQSLGRDVEFTFVRLVREEERYRSELLRWNDDAGRAEQQLVPPAREM
jgi:UDP-2,3-diacylglucosamine pyrophosphatase LpxH